MANSKVNFTDIGTRIPEPVMELKDLIKSKSFEYGDLKSLVTIIGDVDFKKKIGFLGELGDIGVKANSVNCSLNEVQALMSTTGKDWDPQDWDTQLKLCAEDVEGTIAQLSLKKGVQKYDLTDTEYFDLFVEALEIAVSKMYIRFVWFADKDAANVSDSPGGFITDGKDVNFINVIDGLWKRARAIIAATPEQRIAIPANAQVTSALQNSTLTKELALTYAENLYFNAPLDMQAEMIGGGYKAYCTVAYFNKLIRNFQSFELESMKTNLENGLFSIKVNGLEFVPVPDWDKMINTWENLGASKRDPFRVLVYETANALVGVPDLSTWGMFDAYYWKKDKAMYIDLADKIDALFLHDNRVMVAI